MDYVTLYAQPLMKILLLGEYSNVHATLAKGLKTLGHEVTVLSNGDFWKNYPRDIDMVRTYTKWGGIRYLLRMLRILPKLKGYDIVHYLLMHALVTDHALFTYLFPACLKLWLDKTNHLAAVL